MGVNGLNDKSPLLFFLSILSICLELKTIEPIVPVENTERILSLRIENGKSTK